MNPFEIDQVPKLIRDSEKTTDPVEANNLLRRVCKNLHSRVVDIEAKLDGRTPPSQDLWANAVES